MAIRAPITALFIAGLTACGGGSDSGNGENMPPNTAPPAPTVLNGIFVDAPVSGLNWQTTSQTGTTDSAGTFSYVAGETITFSIGNITLPAIDARDIITPLEIFNTDNVEQTSVTNLLRLLQSLDLDGIADNGIEVSDLAHQLAADITLDFSAASFDEDVATFLQNGDWTNQTLISAQQAQRHFNQQLAQINMGNCGNDHPMVGFRGEFVTLAHGVTGTATIMDNCTIAISNFNYDGGGPEVYAYAGINHEYSANTAFAISGRLNGGAHSNAALTWTLPANKTLDDLTGIAVWCVDFNADFGHVDFVAP